MDKNWGSNFFKHLTLETKLIPETGSLQFIILYNPGYDCQGGHIGPEPVLEVLEALEVPF